MENEENTPKISISEEIFPFAPLNIALGCLRMHSRVIE